MKCLIQWIDADSKPTSDENEAVMLAHFHKFTSRPTAWGKAGLICEYLPEIDRSYPICANHLHAVEDEMRYENGGGWSFSEL